ncbi:hypothetical protein CISG_08136 [Coccidioides immitis RMSCC 3703]|uniref:Uncharacterized protein n=2 Tax=Coccidioides immitis TaxID=5501 RepID=A0A0J8R599_COCIT|nr:hypothetical protein CIRG_01008 [Coccidioides immitis RMSCC 2394]KMU79976.1 hypothetical protein CISG_08136 [Coccidioides immitis RMSCC 3703]
MRSATSNQLILTEVGRDKHGFSEVYCAALRPFNCTPSHLCSVAIVIPSQENLRTPSQKHPAIKHPPGVVFKLLNNQMLQELKWIESNQLTMRPTTRR